MLLCRDGILDGGAGLVASVSAIGLNVDFVGLDARRRSLSFSISDTLALTGEGESSIISTQPDESLAELFFSFDLSEEALSKLVLVSTLLLAFSAS